MDGDSCDAFGGYFQGPGTICDETTCTPGDMNADGAVNAGDLAEMLGNWGPCGMDMCAGDLNNSAAVDAADLATLLGNWGE